jgi:hypothetical protein
VSILLSGPWGYAMLLLLVLGLPLQLAVGGLVAMQRRMWTWAVLLVPMLVLLTALASIIVSLNASIHGLAQTSDPAWVPWFALDDRARATLLGVPGGVAAAILCGPVAIGAAFAGFRAWRPSGSRLVRAVGIAFFIFYAIGLQILGISAAFWFENGAPLFFLALGSPLFMIGSVLASSQRDPRRFGTAAAGFGALLVGVGGLLLATISGGFSKSASAFGSFDDPFGQVGAVVHACVDAAGASQVAALLALASIIGAVPPLVARDIRRLDGQHGLDVLVSGGLGLLLVLAGGWAVARERVLTFSAGAHAMVVLAASQDYAVPFLEPVPARVLVGSAESPRWIMMRERGGVETVPIAGALDIVGPAILRNDGLMFPPGLLLEDFYLSLFESAAGAVSVVGCLPTSDELRLSFTRDPLLATGRCGAFPLTLRVTSRLADPRVLIVLKDRLVDDRGDILSAEALTDVDGRDVIVRGQLDATMADLVVTLARLSKASRVYLGHGVTTDGDDLPIGVDPGLRITKLPQERAAQAIEAGSEGAEPAPAAPPAAQTPADIMREQIVAPG